jgi:RNA polymerase sigma-70 factor (ECF subfamily)
MHLIIIPRDLARELHEPLRHYYRDNPSVHVIVERRAGAEDPPTPGTSRQRRAGDRSPRPSSPKVVAASGHPSLPPEAIPYLDRLGVLLDIDSEATGATDAESLRLVASFQHGDRRAFEELYLLHFDGIYDFLRVTLGSADRAEDLAQEVFLKAHDALSGYRRRPNVPFLAWLRKIALNRARSELRRRPDPEPRDPSELSEAGSVAQTWLSERALTTLVQRLPSPQQQQAFMLRHLLGLSVDETAAVMGKTENSIMQLTTRALTHLRGDMREADDPPPDSPPQHISMSRRARPSLVVANRRGALNATGFSARRPAMPGYGPGIAR